MRLHQDIAQADDYIAKANKNVEKQRRLLTRTRNPHTAVLTQGLLDVLVALLANVKNKREKLRGGYSATRGSIGRT